MENRLEHDDVLQLQSKLYIYIYKYILIFFKVKSEFKKRVKNPYDESEKKSKFKIPIFTNFKSK